MLLDKLAHCGVRKTEKDLFKTYLTNRKQHIAVNGQTFDSALIEFWVSQGSVLFYYQDLILKDLNFRISSQYIHWKI